MNMKALFERRNAIVTEMETMLGTETRALTEEERTKYNELKEEIRAIDERIDAAEEIAKAKAREIRELSPAEKKPQEVEERAFECYIRGIALEERAGEMAKGANGAVIPSSIANKIISKVLEISPIAADATRYNIGGTLTIPFYDESAGAITMAYATEFTALTSSSGKTDSVSLTGFLAGALTKVSASLVNNSQFDIVSFVIGKMAEAVAKWLEKELLQGTTNKIAGLSTATKTVTTASTTAIAADELIDLQEEIPDAYQAGAYFIMSKSTRKSIRKLKDGDGNYLLNKDFTARWGYTLLGKDVYVSANMPDVATGVKAVYYLDPTGLALKISEDAEVQVLREKFADEHAVGVITWMEVDSKIENSEKVAVLKIK